LSVLVTRNVNIGMLEDRADDVETRSVRETIAQIRFGLNQLSSRNGHHEFEELTRFLARETVCRNILPGTGPVSAGGDQGRDFETFKAFIAGQVLPLGSKLGMAEGNAIAFACTLQADDIVRKILSDVEKIMGQGAPVEHIVYYCEANVPVGRRHQLQASVLENHEVHLEIFDGAAISELLSQRHLYWIAQEFLHLPAATLPPGPERPGWYESDLRRWRENDHLPTTPGDLVDLSGCLRYATFHEEARSDLPFWIEKLVAFLRGGLSNRIEQMARYEIAVAQLRGLGDLRPADDLVSTYMRKAVESNDPSELGDASVLLMYCIGARVRGLTEHDAARLQEWNQQLQEQAVDLLEATDQPGRRCTLLETLGWLRSQPDLLAAQKAGIPYELSREIPLFSLDEIDDISRRDLVEPVDVPLVDLAGAFDAWAEMISFMDQAPLFPVERTGQMLCISAPILIDDDRYDYIVTSIDARIAEVAGSAAAATNARDRAITFHRNGRLLDALRDVHRARIGWFSGETSEGMVLSSLMMSQIYGELNLQLASKYTAMTTARLVGKDNQELYARACFKAAEADYHQAAWFSSIAFADLALRAHSLFAEDPYNYDRHQHLQNAILELSIIRGVAKVVDGEYSAFVSGALERTRVNELLDEVIDGLEAPPWWEQLSPNELAQYVSEELGQLGFSDGGTRRSLTWAALGVTWEVEFPNDYDSTIVAERLAAFAQITLAELALQDPALLPTRVVFDVEVCDKEEEMVLESRADGDGTRWRVRLPQVGTRSPDGFQKIGQETLTVVMSAISDVSVLPQNELSAIFDRLVSQGLLGKLTFGTVYDVAYGEMIPRSTFEEAPRETTPPLDTGVTPQPRLAPELVPDGPGPHYDPDKSINLVRGRYENITKILTATLPELRSHEPFLEVVKHLRAAGWKDWHILMAVVHVAQNNRFQFIAPRTEAETKEFFELFTSPEATGEPAPLRLFTEDALRKAIRFSWPSTLKVWGLVLKQNPPDIQAIENLLAQRYSYWLDDSPHDDPFLDN
jgi:hypothetical protein